VPLSSSRTSNAFKLAYLGLALADSLLSGLANPKAHRARQITKPLLMPTLMASLATNPAAAASPLRTTTLLAQAGGWGGDVLLMGHGTTRFAAGSGSFALGHAAYITGFRQNRATSRQPGVKAVALLWALTAPGMIVGAAKKEKVLGPTIAAYSGVLATTVAAATQLDPGMPRAARRMTILGATLFMISDGILGTRKFLLNSPPPRLETAVMATYTGAQFLLCEGASRA
jgi:uncharacterized membrane protein YhhN